MLTVLYVGLIVFLIGIGARGNPAQGLGWLGIAGVLLYWLYIAPDATIAGQGMPEFNIVFLIMLFLIMGWRVWAWLRG